jgi:hypothetical protein
MRLAGIDLAAALLRRSVRADLPAPCCAGCGRRPLPGELLHVYDAGRSLCTLCQSRLPDAERAPLRSERIHAAERHLSVMPRAA